MKEAKWINGKQVVTGRWEYNWPRDEFVIWLDKKDRITGDYKKIITTNDFPEWGNWKLVKGES